MKILKELDIEILGTRKSVFFGQPDTREELDEMFRFRFQEYSRRGYIDPSRFPDRCEKDEYDLNNKCEYFIAYVEGRVVGTVRLIRDKILPTEIDFSFIEPREMASIARTQRGELGRLIVVPFDKEKRVFFPRGLILLVLLSVLVEFGVENGITGGYSFIKTTLKKKMERLKMPVHFIEVFNQRYPAEGILYKYFNQPMDIVVPIYFILDELKAYFDNIFNKGFLFEVNDDKIILKNNLFAKVLLYFGLI